MIMRSYLQFPLLFCDPALTIKQTVSYSCARQPDHIGLHLMHGKMLHNPRPGIREWAVTLGFGYLHPNHGNPSILATQHSHARSIIAWSHGSHRATPRSSLTSNGLVRWPHSSNLDGSTTPCSRASIFQKTSLPLTRPHAADKQVPRPCRQDCQEPQLTFPTIVASLPEPQIHEDHSSNSRIQQLPRKAAKRAEIRGLAITCAYANAHQRTVMSKPSPISK
jgi:hypothetical protein